MNMENITSIKTKTTEGLPGEAALIVETTLMETEEGHGGQALVPERIETVAVTELVDISGTRKGNI
jgi:hypothetical protein